MDLEPFNRINPCGYQGLRMTQLAALGPDHQLEGLRRPESLRNLQQVAQDFVPHLLAALGFAATSPAVAGN